MKNIHIVPTDKPSRIAITDTNVLGMYKVEQIAKYGTNQNIYITSDDEIKDCWVLNTHTNEVYFLGGYYGIQPITKKIILSTDGDLIKDGVQSIDDEFVEWFVKNPSCEYVTIRNKSVVRAIVKGIGIKNFYNGYKIIIPKEDLIMEVPMAQYSKQEQKQHLIDMMNDDEDLGLYNETFDEYLIRLKDRRTEDNYNYYTDEELELYNEYIMDCWRCGMSVYKCLEFMYFAEKEIKVEDVFNDEKREGVKQFISEHKQLENDWEEILFDFIDFYPCILPNELFEWLEENYEIPKKKKL